MISLVSEGGSYVARTKISKLYFDLLPCDTEMMLDLEEVLKDSWSAFAQNKGGRKLSKR